VILVSVAISKPITLPLSFTIPLFLISTSTSLCHSTTPCKVAQPSAFVLLASPSIISRQRVASQFILVCFACWASSSGTLPLWLCCLRVISWFFSIILIFHSIIFGSLLPYSRKVWVWSSFLLVRIDGAIISLHSGSFMPIYYFFIHGWCPSPPT